VLSRKAKYAVKALLILARNQGNNPMKIPEIAVAERMPKKFLEQILMDLKRCGFIASRQGANGGFYMLRKPEDIKIEAVIRSIDGPIALLPCVSLNFYEPCADCINEAYCGLRNLMKNVRDETLKILSVSVADLLNDEEILKEQHSSGKAL
jgi:Rrf2 family protein